MALNPQQETAASHRDGPIIINAGAGSGKTHTIIERMIRLIQSGVEPESILAVTFTNKAAKEMKERTLSRVAKAGITGSPLVGTFHSISNLFLRRYASKIGIQKNFTILDNDDSTKVAKRTVGENEALIKGYGFQLKAVNEKELKSRVSRWKNHGIYPEEAKNEAKNDLEGCYAALYEKYQEMLTNERAMDFDDLILCFLYLVEHDDEVLKEIQERFQYFFIDEYQDTNVIQYRLVHKLAEKSRNLCVIGDDCQSIYSFRYADLDNILNFKKDWPDAKEIRLEANYRSGKEIVDAANRLISRNRFKLDKRLFSSTGKEGYVSYTEYETANDEAEDVARLIRKSDTTDWAILYRTNALSRFIEESLLKNGIPYRLFGSLSFSERAEVKDICSYLFLLSNGRNRTAFERVIPLSTTGIGVKALAKLNEICSEKFDGDFMELCMEQASGMAALPKKAATSFQDFCQLMRSFLGSLSFQTVPELIESIIRKTNYFEKIKASYDADTAQDKMQNVNELKAMAMDERGEDALNALLARITMFHESKEDENVPKVSLMTIHKSKGLEFGNVALVAMEETIIPNKNAIFAPPKIGLEEERRLMYVAITRAKDRLFVSFSKKRRGFAGTEYNPRSRFIDEMRG